MWPKQHICGFCGRPVRPWQRRTYGGIAETWEAGEPATVHHRKCFEKYFRDLLGEQQDRTGHSSNEVGV